MRLTEHGYCIYHDKVVEDHLCAYKEERCLACDYLIPRTKYTTVEEAAELLGKSQPTIRSWIKKGKLKADSHEFVDRYPNRRYRYKVYFIERESLSKLVGKDRARLAVHQV